MFERARQFVTAANRLQTRFERQPLSTTVTTWSSFGEKLLEYAISQNDEIVDQFLKRWYPGVETPPPIFREIGNRWNEQWRLTVQRVTAQAIDTQVSASSNASIGQRLTGLVLNLLNRFGVAGTRARSTLQVGDRRYWIYTIQYLASSLPMTRMRRDSIRTLRTSSLAETTPIVTEVNGRNTLLTSELPPADEDGMVLVKRLAKSDFAKAEVVLPGFTRTATSSKDGSKRVWTMKYATYIKMLFETLPRQLVRELTLYRVEFTRADQKKPALFRYAGGVMGNSAAVCRFLAGKVLTRDALDYATSSPDLRVHAFHPNCRHSIQPVPLNYDGPVVTKAVLVRVSRQLNF